MIAEKDENIKEAYNQLEIISQNKQKRIDYTSRLKSIMDYNTIMEERLQEGISIGRQEGRQETLKELIAAGINIPDEILKKLM